MKDKYFLDTNILIYTFDNSSPAKQNKAQKLVDQALTEGIGAISFQVVQEFLNVCSRTFAVPFQTTDAKSYLEEVLMPLCELFPNVELYHACLDIRDKTGYSFYDSLIVASAIRLGCKTLYSEDLQHERTISRLTIVNPFS